MFILETGVIPHLTVCPQFGRGAYPMLDEKGPTSDRGHVDEQFVKVVVVVDFVMEEPFLGDMIQCLRRLAG